jgi:hypothetical protein
MLVTLYISNPIRIFSGIVILPCKSESYPTTSISVSDIFSNFNCVDEANSASKKLSRRNSYHPRLKGIIKTIATIIAMILFFISSRRFRHFLIIGNKIIKLF